MAYYQSKSPGYGRAFLNLLLAAFAVRPAAALLAAPKLRLSKDPAFGPGPDSTLASLTSQECDFSGYTPGGYALTLAGPVNASGGNQGEIGSATAIGTTATPFVANSIYGYWIDDGTNIVESERFDLVAPLQVSAPGDYVEIDAVLPLNLTPTL